MEAINADCQVFTPQNIVIEVLNQVGYQKNLYGKKVMENSCGDGAFLIEIVERYILDCLANKFTIEEIICGLEQDIFGAEIDENHINTCISNLNNIIKKYNIKNVKWNIMQVDILKITLENKFHFIIGNPPYITYSDLSKQTRNFIREEFEVCKEGKPDYYYAFIEMSLKALDNGGKLAYLIPNNIFKNKFADRLRCFILPYLNEIVDYKNIKLFKNRLTSSAIIICDSIQNLDSLTYINKLNNFKIELSKKDLKDKWIFRKNVNIGNNETRKFGDDFYAMCSIATLSNEVYILKNYKVTEDYIIVGKFKIEKRIIREAVSPRSLQYDRKELIVFPYEYDRANKLIRYSEDNFQEYFPGTNAYLQSFIEKLNKRDKDKNAKWFEFGRSQALSHINQEKILLSTLITEKVRLHHISCEQVPYAGICIYPKGEKTLDIAEKILKSDEFLQYVYDIGINVSGNTMRITAKDICNFEYML